MSTGAAWMRVLAVPWQRRRNQGSMWPWAVIVGLLVAMTFGLAMFVRDIPVGAALAVLLCLVVLIGWFAFVMSLLQQNEPHAARLVPGHVRTLRTAWATGWAAITLLFGMIGAGYGFAPAAALVTALALLAISWMARWPWLGAIVWIASALLARIADSSPARALGNVLAQAWQAAPWAVGAVVTLVVAACVVASAFVVLQSGDARHVRNYRWRTAADTLMRTGSLAASGDLPRSKFLRMRAAWPYAAWLNRATASPHGPRGSVLSRALLGLGPGLHWSGLASAGLIFGLWFGICALFVFWLYPQLNRLSTPAVLWPGIALLAWLSSAGGQARGAVYRSRREQAVLMLLPGMPRGVDLNRPLARRLLLQFLLAWAVSALLVTVVIGWRHPRSDWLVDFTAACLWPAVWMCADWSRIPAPGVSTTLLPALLPIALVLLAQGLQTWLGVPVAVCALLLATGAITVTAWRYRLALRAPTAFPAARLR